MVNQEDRKVAALLIDEALNSRGLEKSRWLRQLLQSGDSEFHVLMKERREMVGRHLGWAKPGRRVVPENQITQFVVDCLGVDILRLPQIRFLLIENGIEINNSEFDFFLNYIPPKFSFGNDPSAEQISSIEIGVGTTLARQFCKFVNLPLSFSTRGSSDERSNFEEIQASKSLPDLVEFQEIVKNMLTEKCLDKSGGRGMVVMPTGSGKTRTMIETLFEYVFQLQEWPRNIVWIADREELCEQAFQSFKEVFVNLTQNRREEYEANGMKIPPFLHLHRYWGGRNLQMKYNKNGDLDISGVVVTSVQQLQARMKNEIEEFQVVINNSEFIIVDEAHRNIDYVDELNVKLKQDNPNCVMIGLTATPMRRDSMETGLLREIFEGTYISPISGAENNIELMKEKLTEIGILAEKVDVDYEEVIDNSKLAKLNPDIAYQGRTIQLIDHIIELGARSILVFTRDVNDARVIASYLRMKKNPVTAEHLESGTNIDIRRSMIHGFRNGNVRVLLNYAILTTGFDAPKTDAVLICRPHLDEYDSVFQQMVGRGLRGHEFGGTHTCFVAHLKDY
jgi:DNA repair protein RadD